MSGRFMILSFWKTFDMYWSQDHGLLYHLKALYFSLIIIIYYVTKLLINSSNVIDFGWINPEYWQCAWLLTADPALLSYYCSNMLVASGMHFWVQVKTSLLTTYVDYETSVRPLVMTWQSIIIKKEFVCVSFKHSKIKVDLTIKSLTGHTIFLKCQLDINL